MSPLHDFSFSCYRCGKCNANSTLDCKADCTAVWGGPKANDKCGVCQGSNTCLDCIGTPNGKASKDK